jgi:hypothetical protein
MNVRWPQTEELVDEVVKVLGGSGIDSGNLIDVCARVRAPLSPLTHVNVVAKA